jgi:sugar phosphate isomerase/epimerase
MCKDKVGLVHIIDNDGSLYAGFTSMHNAFGTGNIDFDRVMPALRDLANYNGEWWVVDLVHRLVCSWHMAAGQLAVFQGASEAPISES